MDVDGVPISRKDLGLPQSQQTENVATQQVDNYYSRNLNQWSFYIYFGVMAAIFLSFGFIRKIRRDQKKNKKEDKVQEMMNSFGLKECPTNKLLTLKKSFNAKLEIYAATTENQTLWVKRCNKAGAIMKLGTNQFYCGRNLGVEATPGSQGQCGPIKGPQCSDCKDSNRLILQNKREGFSMAFYCGRIPGFEQTPEFQVRCEAKNGPQCKDCQFTTATLGANQKGYFSWCWELWKIESSEIRRNCGLEAYLYLQFVKRSAQFFFWVALVSCGVLLPTFTYETEQHPTNWSELIKQNNKRNNLEQYTLLNVLGKPWRMWIVFGVTIVIGISGHLFVYFYQTSTTAKKHDYEEKHKLDVSENTIRNHTLFIKGINTELAPKEARKLLKEIWPTICSSVNIAFSKGGRPLAIDLIYDYEILIPLMQQIQRNGFKNEFYKDFKSSKFKQEFQQKQKYKGCLCFKKPVATYLTQHYYLRKRTLLRMQMDRAIELREKQNTGHCLIILDCSNEVDILLKDFHKVKKHLGNNEICKKLHLSKWQVEKAPLHSNILWQNFFEGKSLVNTLKATLINLMLFTLAVSFVTPIYFMEILKNQGVTEIVGWVKNINNYIGDQVYLQLAPVVLLVANYILMPTLIDQASHFMGFRKRSERHGSNFNKHYVSLITNALLIPLFGLTSIKTLISYLTSTETEKIETKALETTNFFIRFLTGLSLFSNFINALDAPHWALRTVKIFLFNRQPEFMKLYPYPYRDTYFFDVGYQLAFVTVIWSIGIFFSAIAPIIPTICLAYFGIKYWIDKYNLMYVYPSEYDTAQPFTQKAAHFCTFAIFGFQLFMFILFTFSFGEDFYIAAVVLLGIEVIGQMLKYLDFTYFYQSFIEKELVNNRKVNQQIDQAIKVINKKFQWVIETGGQDTGMFTQDGIRHTMGIEIHKLSRVIQKIRNQSRYNDLESIENFEIDPVVLELKNLAQKAIKESSERLTFKIDLILREVEKLARGDKKFSVKEKQVLDTLKECIAYVYQHPVKHFHQSLAGSVIQEKRLNRMKRKLLDPAAYQHNDSQKQFDGFSDDQFKSLKSIKSYKNRNDMDRANEFSQQIFQLRRQTVQIINQALLRLVWMSHEVRVKENQEQDESHYQEEKETAPGIDSDENEENFISSCSDSSISNLSPSSELDIGGEDYPGDDFMLTNINEESQFRESDHIGFDDDPFKNSEIQNAITEQIESPETKF